MDLATKFFYEVSYVKLFYFWEYMDKNNLYDKSQSFHAFLSKT